VPIITKEQIKNSFPVQCLANIPENNKLTGEPTSTKEVVFTINQKKFTKAKRENPDSDKYYVKQINSYDELFE